MNYPMVRRPIGRAPGAGLRLSLDAFADAACLHPEVVRRLVALGLLDPEPDASGRWWFAPADLATTARIQRLRAGFGINYAGLGLVLDLIDRVAELESTLQRLRSVSRRIGGTPWI
ncbi:MAG: chaperone modulator CbpM [Micromonosporaceae bacterium]